MSELITPDFAFAMNQNMEAIRKAGLDESFDYDSVLCDEEKEELEEYESELEDLKNSIKIGENNLKEELAKPFHLQDKEYLRQVRGALQLLEMEANDIEDNILLLKESARETSQ